MNGENTKLVDSSGMSHDISSYKLFVTLGIGWAAFGLSLIFNILYYALHPSQVTLITLICVQSSLISPPGRPVGHHQEAGGGCVWLWDQSGHVYQERFEFKTEHFRKIKIKNIYRSETWAGERWEGDRTACWRWFIIFIKTGNFYHFIWRRWRP